MFQYRLVNCLRGKVLWNVLLIGAYGLISLMGCSEQEEPPILSVPSVTVTPVRQETVPIYEEYVGETGAFTNVEVRARVEGILLRAEFKEGMEVEKGELLFVIDPEPHKIALENAQAKLERDAANFRKASNDVKRLRPLAEAKAVSQQKLDDAIAKAKETRAIWKGSQTAVKDAKLKLGYTTVRAPISGLIGRRKVSVGSLVGKGEPTLLAVVSRLDPIYVNFTMSEQDAFMMRDLHERKQLGRAIDGSLPIHMFLQDGREFPHTGAIDFVDRQFESTMGTLAFRAKFPNPNHFLRPGMYARVLVLLTENTEALLVPQRAVQEEQGRQFVLVVQDNKTVQRRSITAGHRHGDEWIIDTGVNVDEHVVVMGQQRVRPGMTVNPMMADPEQAKVEDPHSSPTQTNH
ncbi:MAG: efflux RND transporter periplasmic adaptor subunit [Nitrospirota bacterium]|nr:MAG: efflux RND transporter periplasmic adaptor subunit [Nitrospirota bacterium]